MATDISATELVKCPHCAERVLPDAKVCRYCGGRIRSRGLWKIIGVVALAVVGLLIFFAIIGESQRTQTYGSNYALYDTMTIYPPGITNDEADKLVNEIADKADVSHDEAEHLAMAAVKAGVAPSNWIGFAVVAQKMQRLRNEGALRD